MAERDDPVLSHARREAVSIAIVWLLATAATCSLCYWLGYERPGFQPGLDDIRPILGMPLWFAVGVILPWAACAAWTWWFVLFRMHEDDLGADHAAELNVDIQEEGAQDA